MLRRRLMLTVLTAAMLSLVISAAAAARDYAECVPGDFLMYYGFPYSQETAAKIDASKSGKLLQDEQFLKILDELFSSLPMDLEESNPLEKAGLTWKDLLALKHGGYGFALNVKMVKMENPPEDMPEGMEMPPMLSVEMVLFIDKSNAELKAVLDKALKAMNAYSEKGDDQKFEKSEVNLGAVKAVFYKPAEDTQAGMEGIYMFDQGDMTIFATNKALVEKVIGLMTARANDSLAKSELYTKAIAKLGDKRMTAFFFNVTETMTRFGDQLKQNEESSNVLKALNMDSLQAIVGSEWVDENSAMSQIYLYCPDGKFTILKPLQSGRANFNTLNGVNDKAFAFVSVSVDPVGLFDWISNLMKEADETGYDDFMQSMQDAEKELGFKIKEELLASFGGEMTIVMTSPSLQGDAKGFAVPVAGIVELKDKLKAEAILKKIYEKNKIEPEIQEYGAAKHQINVLPMAAVCLTDKFCVIANSTRTMEELLDVMDAAGGNITATAHFKSAKAILGDNISLLMYINLKDLANVLDNIEKWQNAFGGGAEEPEGPIDEEDGGDGEDVPAPDDEDMPFAFATLGLLVADDAADEDAPPAEKEPVKQMAALLKVVGNYMPAIYIGVGADKEGIFIKMVMP